MILFAYGSLKHEMINKFMDETIGMLKKDREEYYISNFQ